MTDALVGLAVLLSTKNPLAVRQVSFAYLRGGSLANGVDGAKAWSEFLHANGAKTAEKDMEYEKFEETGDVQLAESW